MKNRVLFVTEKWCEGTPDVTWTNTHHNLFWTFQQHFGTYNFDTLHIDEAVFTYKSHINDVLPRYCVQRDIGIIFCMLFGESDMNPSPQTFEALHNFGIKICFVWPDSGAGWAIRKMLEYQHFTTLNISWDYPTIGEDSILPKLQSMLPLWTPESSFLYYRDDKVKRDIDVSFLGSRYYPRRQQEMGRLMELLPNVFISGGQREAKLSPSEYGDIIRRSKVMLNLPYHPLGFAQLKGRPLQATACNTLLIELSNASTSQFFRPGVDYVTAENFEDMAQKVYYYLEHEDERLKIAESGHQRFLDRYTAKHYWDIILNALQPS